MDNHEEVFDAISQRLEADMIVVMIADFFGVSAVEAGMLLVEMAKKVKDIA